MSRTNDNFYYCILRFHLCSWFIGIILHRRYWHWSMYQVVNSTSASYLISSFSLKVEATIINFFPSSSMSLYHWTLLLLFENRYQNKWSGYVNFTWLWSITNLITHYWGILDSGPHRCFALKLSIFNIVIFWVLVNV